MEKLFVPYELALKLKELNFNEPCVAFYDGNKKFTYSPNNPKIYTIKTLAPTWEQAFDFFRKKGIESWIEQYPHDEMYIYQIPLANFVKIPSYHKEYNEAREICLEKLINFYNENSNKIWG